jgi:hypothetical protein
VRVRSADDLIAPAVANTIQQLQTDLSDEDAAAVRLAERYAAAIDDADDKQAALDKLGPKLLAVLESLGATPKGRAVIGTRVPKEDVGGVRITKLQALRDAR